MFEGENAEVPSPGLGRQNIGSNRKYYGLDIGVRLVL